MNNFIHHKLSTPNINHINKEINIPNKEIPYNTLFNFNNKNIKLTVLPQSLSQNKNIQFQPTNNHIPKLIQPDKLKHFYNFYEKESSKKNDTNYKEVFNNNIIELKDLIGKNSYRPIDIKILSEPISKFNQGKISSKSFGEIISYAANTNQGIVRNYNEDRVSIIINMNKIGNYQSSKPWPKISYFAIFDGHAGNKCAEYLRENLLKLICSNKYFPDNIPEAIKLGFEKADDYFLNNYAIINGQLKDNSGTCGLILLIVNNELYIGNVGDSRCIGSFGNGKIQHDITRDHKPNAPYEKERIMSNGGQIYQTKTNIKIEENFILRTKILLGPYRVFPGRLSVSRTIGDAEGKIALIGGNPKVIISKPDIYKYNITENDIDFFILGCDGIFDQMSSDDVFKCVQVVIERNKELYENKNKDKDKYESLYGNKVDIHTTSGDIVDMILKGAMLRQSYDNVTCLLICFKNLLNTDFVFLNKDKNSMGNNIRDKYASKRNESKNMMYSSNSNNDYNKNKKNINIHEINKFMQKLKSSGSDSSLFKKKEEIIVSNESKEYSAKPLMNLYIKTYNKNEKYSQLKGKEIRNNSNNNNNEVNLTLKNDKKINANENKNFQIIYKKENKEKNIIGKNSNNEASNSEEKNKQFYNKKKIYFTGFKKTEPTDSNKKEKKGEDSDKKNYKQKEDKNNDINNKIIDSRNINLFKNKKSLKLNSFMYKNNNDTSYTLNNYNNNNKIKGMSSSLKKFYNYKDKEENNKNNYKLTENNDKENTITKKHDIEKYINNNNFTDTKIRSNNTFNSIINNKANQLNLLKNFSQLMPESNIISNYKNPKNNTTYINTSENINQNQNSSFQAFKPYKSLGAKKAYPSYKKAINLKDKETEKNIITDYNNNKGKIKYLFSNKDTINKRNSNTDNTNSNEKYKTSIENKEPKNNESKKNKLIYYEIKPKYSSFLLRSNTESNYYREKKF